MYPAVELYESKVCIMTLVIISRIQVACMFPSFQLQELPERIEFAMRMWYSSLIYETCIWEPIVTEINGNII